MIYLACVLAGCPVVSIADSFAAPEIASRLRIARAKGIFTQASSPARWLRATALLPCARACRPSGTASLPPPLPSTSSPLLPPCSTYLLPRAQDVVMRAGKALPLYERVRAADAPVAIVLPGAATAVGGSCGELLAAWRGQEAAGGAEVLRTPLRAGDVAWSAFVSAVAPASAAGFSAHEADAYDVTNILFSSGTTVGGHSVSRGACRGGGAAASAAASAAAAVGVV